MLVKDKGKVAPSASACLQQIDTDTNGKEPPTTKNCLSNTSKIEPGECGCNKAKIDTSAGDGTLECNNQCPAARTKFKPSKCVCGIADVDMDGDGTANCNDVCVHR